MVPNLYVSHTMSETEVGILTLLSNEIGSSSIVIGSSQRFFMVGSRAERMADRHTSSPVSSVMILYVILFPICFDIPTHLPRNSLDFPGNDCCDSSSKKILVAKSRNIAMG
jgi:hypothetical protein